MTESSETAHDKFWNINLLLDCDCVEGAAAYRRLGGETLCNINKCTLGKNAFIVQRNFPLQRLLCILFLYRALNIYALQQCVLFFQHILWYNFSEIFHFLLVWGISVLRTFWGETLNENSLFFFHLPMHPSSKDFSNLPRILTVNVT